MKWLKAFIIILVIIIIIVCALLIVLLKNEKNNIVIDPNHAMEITGVEPKTVSLSRYFSVKASAEKLINYAQSKNSEAVYDLLNLTYKSDNNITASNALEITNLNNITKYKIKEIYELIGQNNHYTYYIRIITNQGYTYLDLKWDNITSSFDVTVITKEEYEKYLKTAVTKVDETTIERSKYNSIPHKYLEEMDVVKEYFNDYINSAINFPEEAYNSLNEKYRNAKFGSLENFKQYVTNNKELQNIYKSANADYSQFTNKLEYLVARSEAKLEKYSVEEEEDYTRYICIDSYDNYYIFDISSPMIYTLILDTYTIDIPQFTNKYYESNDQERAILNLNKFRLAINDGDYKTAYSMLADSFKTQNFPTLDQFERYIKSNLFEKNEFEYVKFGNEAGTYYTYSVNITDKTKTSNNVINKTFIILFEEGTNFQISFNI